MAAVAEPPGGEHGIDNQADALVGVGRQLRIILVRLVRDLVAVHTHMADARRRDELEQAVDHTEARRAEWAR